MEQALAGVNGMHTTVTTHAPSDALTGDHETLSAGHTPAIHVPVTDTPVIVHHTTPEKTPIHTPEKSHEPAHKHANTALNFTEQMTQEHHTFNSGILLFAIGQLIEDNHAKKTTRLAQ
jgi:lipopolysaccharide biosynthesis glycosyltransferase